MKTARLDKNTLARSLRGLDAQRQLAFGAMCSERLIANYLAFQEEADWGDHGSLRASADHVWSYLGGEQPNRDVTLALLEACQNATPAEDHHDLYEFLLRDAAQDACFAVLNLLSFLLESDVSKIIHVANHAINSVDYYVQEIENLAPNDPHLEDLIRRHPLMQREIRRQKDSLKTLQDCEDFNRDFIDEIRSTARADGGSLAEPNEQG